MSLKNRVSWKEMRLKCKEKDLPFKTTADLEPLEAIVGQDRAAQALQFGLRVKHHGYNIFVCGPNGTGKSTYVKTLLKEIAKDKTTPEDWCYVYNFEEEDHPIAINLPAGMGITFKNDISELVTDLKASLPKAFSNEQYEKTKNAIIDEYFKRSNEMYDLLEEEANIEGFTISKTNTGLGSIPLIDGKPVTEEDYEALTPEEKERWAEKGKKMQFVISSFIKHHRALEKDFKNELRELDQKLGKHVVEEAISELEEKYAKYPKVYKYLDSLQVNIVKNIEEFLPKEEDNSLLPLLKKDTEDPFKRYGVNLIVDNSQTEGAPVIIETTPNYQNLMGFIEYHGQFGVLTTDFLKIKRGALHQANGGYLVLQAIDVLKYPLVWDSLKNALLNKQIKTSDVNRTLGLSLTATLHPEPIPLDLKVILIGEQSLYHLLYHYDKDFAKLFKIKAEFDLDMERNTEHILKYASFIAAIVKQNGLKTFTKSAVGRIVEYGSEVADDKIRLSTRFNRIAEIVYEADEWAAVDGAKKVTADYVQKAIAEKTLRSNQIEEKIRRLITERTLLIDIDGEKIGEINALAVYSLGDYAFGRPSKITAKTYMGRSGIINIERESDLSGSIHNKGVLILSGFLGDKFAKDKPLALSASIAFEQSYSGIDGDSASAAELLAILSSLAEVPIRQNYAITGSINQNGDIQPIGGVNEKIEGFYNVCKVKGAAEENAVIIPKANLRNLMLNEEVVDAAKQGTFILYAVGHVDEAVEILMGTSAKDIYKRANEKLANWAQKSGHDRRGRKVNDKKHV